MQKQTITNKVSHFNDSYFTDKLFIKTKPLCLQGMHEDMYTCLSPHIELRQQLFRAVYSSHSFPQISCFNATDLWLILF